MHKVLQSLFFLLVFFLASSTFLLADPPPIEPSANTQGSQATLALPEIVVTANRLDTPISQVTSSMSVITAKDLERKQSTTLYDALQQLPGLDVLKTGGPGETSSIYMRGANDAHTLVLMDGIPLNDPLSTSRSYDYLDQFSVDDVKQVEVVRGPQSTLYGSNAMAGVVNIITQKNHGLFGGSLLFEGGAYNTARLQASVGGGDERGYFSLSTSRFDTSGFPSADKTMGNILNNPDQNSTVSLRAGISPFSNLETNLLVRYNQSHTSLDDGAGPGMDDPAYFADQKQWMVGSQSKWTLLDGDWEQVLGFSFADDNRVYSDDPNPAYINSLYYRGNFDGQTAQINWQNNLHLMKGETLVVGAQGYQEWGNSSNLYAPPPPAAVPVVSSAQTGSLYAESQTNLDERFFLSEGGRFDNHSQFGSHGTYQGGAAYFIPGVETKLKATYGTGFLAPSLFQLYDPTYGNKTLQPENSVGFDVGFEQPLGKDFLTTGAIYFHEDFNNLIQFQATGLLTGTYSNIGKAQSDGVETFLAFKGIQNLEVRANYTYTKAVDAQTGLQLLQRPTDKAGMDIFYQRGDVDFGTSLIYVGPRPDLNYSNYPATPITLDRYFLVNLRGSWQVQKHIKFFARVENLFNQYYEQIWGYGTPGQSVYVGTKVLF